MKKVSLHFALFLIALLLFSCEKEAIIEEVITPEVAIENATTLRKARPVPFKARMTSFISGFQLNPAKCGNLPNVLQSGSGLCSHMGNVSLSISSCPDNATGIVYDGEFTLVGANGDELYLLIPLTTTDPQDPFQGSGAYTVTGGTGRFANASGEGLGSFKIVEFNPPVIRSAVLIEGTLDF